MAIASPIAQPPTLQRTYSPFAGVLSYLVPGLGQMVQGRVGKGLLFFVCIYTLFFYGLYLGTDALTIEGRTYRITGNVYLPDMAVPPQNPNDREWPAVLQNLYNRPQFAGQFWVGIAAWPAILQYRAYDRRQAEQVESELDDLYRKLGPLKENDPEKAQTKQAEIDEKEKTQRHPLLGDLMREPGAKAMNVVQNAGDKRLELAWVYTVIAGVLNIMVIYDAVAGAAYPSSDSEPEKDAL
jgi:TM2 domain-containing membrane protein YozV